MGLIAWIDWKKALNVSGNVVIFIKELKKDYQVLQKIETDDVLEIRKKRKYELMINLNV